MVLNYIFTIVITTIIINVLNNTIKHKYYVLNFIELNKSKILYSK